ncbi:MAG TPA: DNA polymerase III subunit delta [Firmicutes bacterium]|nr:DNA polymerase III subunit delta [Bacillota bacterium]
MRSFGKVEDYLRLKKELQAGSLRPVYLFCGTEDFLLEEALREVADRLLPGEDRASGCSFVDGETTDIMEVLDMADTPGLFTACRLLVVRKAPYFDKGRALPAEAGERLLAAGKKEGTCIVFCAPEAVLTHKTTKALAAAGAVYRFAPLRQAALRAWLTARAAAGGKKFTPGALQAFLARVGTDLRTLASELDKLAAYSGTRSDLTEDDVRAVTVRTLQADIFALIDATVDGRTAQAVFILKDLLAAGEPPVKILSMLGRQFRLLGEAGELLANGHTELAAALKIHPYAAQKLERQAQKTSAARLRRAVALLVRCELDLKRGRIDPVLALETLVVALGVKNG